VSAFFASRPDGLIRWTVLLTVLLLAPVGKVAAQTDASNAEAQRKEKAGAHLKRGAQLIDAEDLTGALAEFEAAYRLVPSPTILHNFGIVFQGLERKAAALDAFERFLDEASKAPPATREHARKAVQTLRPQVAELNVKADVAGAAIFVDGREVGRTPQERPIYLDPGPHQVSVEKTDLGTTHAERVDVQAGQRLALEARVARPAPAAAVAGEVAKSTGATDPEVRAWRRPLAWATTLGAAVAVGVFATELFISQRDYREFNSNALCGTTHVNLSPPRCDQLLRSGRAAEKWAIVSGIAAGALGIGAAVLFFAVPERAEGVSVSVDASGTRLGLGLQGRF
jgi:hypothetical protein